VTYSNAPDLTRLRQAVNASGEVIFMTDREGVFTFVNPQFERLYGYAAVDLVGKATPRVLKGGAIQPAQYAAFWQRLLEGQPVENVFLNRTRDGRLVEMEATVSPIRDDRQTIVGFLTIQRDITARQRADEERRFQQALFAAERELTPEGILVVDEHRRVLSFNRRFADLWRIPADILEAGADTPILDAVKAQVIDPEGFLRRVQELYAHHDEVSREEIALTDGRVFERHSAPMRGADARYYGRVWYFRDVTDRKATETALRRERDRAARYLDVADVMLLALDTDGRVTMINPAGCAILGWTEGELLGRSWIDTCVPERLKDARRETLANLLRGDGSRRENPVLTRSGEERLIAWRSTVLRDETGNLLGTLSSGEDVTERRAAERTLGETQARLQLISDNVLDLVSQIDPDGTFVYVSPSYETLLGYPPSALVGTSAFALVHPEDVPHVQGVLAESIQRRAKARAEFRCRRADGTYVWLETVGKLVCDAANVPTAGVLSGRDISERKRAEQALRDYDRRLRIAIASADIAVFAQDRDLRYTWIHNPQLQVSADQALGHTDSELLPPEIAEPVTEIKTRAIETGQRIREEVSADIQGERRSFELIIEPLRGEGGDVEGITGASLDTTARRQLEDRLRQAQKLEAIGSLAGGIAHDFNNLLTAILGYAGLAQDNLDPDGPVWRDVDEIIRAGQSAESLTRQLLMFSRKSIVRPVLLNLNDTVTGLDKILRRMVGEHVEFEVRLGRDMGLVKADAGQLEQVLMNLVVNARDAMPMGGHLTIETDTAELDESFAAAHQGSAVGLFDSLTVSDNGGGMTPEVQRQIFDPFFTTKGPEKGTGLGLATVHGIVEQASGYLTVDSTPGKGSSFAVYLPRVAGDSEARPASIDATTMPTGHETILFVEDDDTIRAMAVRALQRYGYTVLPARDATEALDRVAATRLDLLITDIVMPGLNGRALAERLRESHSCLKVVYTSGFTDDTELLRGIRSGGTPFVQKPYAVEALARTVRRVLDGL
jgi:two-component system cell cycle sensor histidine kinase/response regulator CckA